jgi:hypothetical protein
MSAAHQTGPEDGFYGTGPMIAGFLIGAPRSLDVIARRERLRFLNL